MPDLSDSKPLPTYDLIIVGAGAAGLCAAIEAGQAGLRTLVVEAFPEPGGAAATSGGGSCLVDTPLQQAQGIHDSVALALSDWLSWGGETVDAAWAQFYLERSREEIYLWLEGLGVEWLDLEHQEGNTVPRWHRPRGGGRALVDRMLAALRSLPVEIRCGTEARRLLQLDGRVTGVELSSGGRVEELSTGAVLIAAGGFTNNPAWLAEYVRDLGPGSRLLCGGARQSLGKGHELLQQVGAHFTHLERIWIYPFGTPDYRDASGTRGIAVRDIEPEVWVNAAGRRFHNELQRSGATGTQALLAQTPATCWAIFDRPAADELILSDPDFRRSGVPIRERVEHFLATSPYVHQAADLEALARSAALPTETLVATIEQFNQWVREGRSHDPACGRLLTGTRPIDRPPFFAMQFFPLARKNLGGVRTDLQCRVLRADGSAIAGLYAAGEVAGMAGGHINGAAALEGTMIAPSMFSGRVAGRAAASNQRF